MKGLQHDSPHRRRHGPGGMIPPQRRQARDQHQQQAGQRRQHEVAELRLRRHGTDGRHQSRQIGGVA